MSRVDRLREVVRAQRIGDLRRAEFQAILDALAPDEEVRALAPAELRGRRGFVVATGRRVFFAHAGLAGTAITPVASTVVLPRLERDVDGTVALVFPGGIDGETRCEAVTAEHAESFRARVVGNAGNGGNGQGPQP